MPWTAEERRAYGRARYAANREMITEQHRAWHAANLEQERRRNHLNNWAVANINPWPYASREELHDLRYAVATHCEYCRRAFTDIVSPNNPRRMEHDHRPPFLFRAISCQRCNICRGHWDRRILAVHEELAYILDI